MWNPFICICGVIKKFEIKKSLNLTSWTFIKTFINNLVVTCQWQYWKINMISKYYFHNSQIFVEQCLKILREVIKAVQVTVCYAKIMF